MIVGYNLTEIRAEKTGVVGGKIDISNNVSISDLKLSDFAIGREKKKALKFVFEFKSSYEPKIGQIVLAGELIYLDSEANVKKIAEEWKKNKKINEGLLQQIVRNIYLRGTIQALILSKEINLPPPVSLVPPIRNSPPPEAKKEKKGKKYVG